MGVFMRSIGRLPGAGALAFDAPAASDLGRAGGISARAEHGPSLLQVRELRTYFNTRRGVIKAVDGVSFDLKPGETVAIVGESGSGKSVTAASIMRLVPNPPGYHASGEVLFKGADLLTSSVPAMRRIRGNEIAMIFQEPMSALNPVYTIGEQIAEVIRLHRNASQAEALRQAAATLDSVGIPDARRRLDDYPHQLSGGMRQRVMIAIALSCDPSVLIADEPTTALDVTIQAQILDLIRAQQVERGLAVLLITHDLGVAAAMADRIVVMYAGRTVEAADATRLLSTPRMPYTRGLIASLPEPGATGRLPAIPGAVPDPLLPPDGCSFNPRCANVEAPCRAGVPPLEQAIEDHDVRCWRWREIANEDVARPRTRAAATPRPQQAPDRPPPLVEVVDLEKSFPAGRHGPFGRGGAIRAVQGVSFEIRRGEVVGLVGESGSGKTTLGRALLRLIEPTSGTVRFDGTELTGLGRRALRQMRRRMQVIFQDPYDSLNARMTVAEALGEAMAIHDLARGAARRQRVAHLLEQVGLPPNHRDRYPHMFSGGQRQRIGIARALAAEPDFIVADEPVSALDLSIQAQIINLLSDLKQQLGLTLLFISHNLAVVEHVCDRVMVMYLGKIVEVAPARVLHANPVHPYTQALISALPSLRPGTRRARIVLRGEMPNPAAPPSGCVFRTRCPEALPMCAEHAPPLREVASGHLAACHLRGGSQTQPRNPGSLSTNAQAP